MDQSEVSPRRRMWVVLLALLSLGAPFLMLFGLAEPIGIAFDHPTKVSYYLQSTLLLGLGIALGAGVLVWGKVTAPVWLRYLSVALGIAGIVIGTLLLLIFIGLCGPTVLWGYCQP